MQRRSSSMSFIPHTEDDVRQMLAAISAKRIEDLFEEILSALEPANFRVCPRH